MNKDLLRKHREEGLSARRIAELAGVSYSKVRYWLLRHGLDTKYQCPDRNRTCVLCGKPYIYDRKKGHTASRCNTCWQRQRRKRCTALALEYKGGECLICGYSQCKRALAYHHLDPAGKDFTIGGAETRSWKAMKSELDKCVLVCMNCHAEIHDGLHSHVAELEESRKAESLLVSGQVS